jgi:hypothetical protein
MIYTLKLKRLCLIFFDESYDLNLFHKFHLLDEIMRAIFL